MIRTNCISSRWLTLHAILLWGFLFGATVQAQNPIVLENRLPGASDWRIPVERRTTRTDWLVAERSAAEIEGYASRTSVAAGEVIRLFVNTTDPSYEMRVYRIGWYGGAGARAMTTIKRTGFIQPACPVDSTTRMVECNWTSPYELRIPADWVSGVYLVKLIGSRSLRENYITFTVRDTRASDFLYLQAVNTHQAYNLWGGRTLYSVGARPAARKVSFNRPYTSHEAGTEGTGNKFFAWEIQMIRWLEREGYDVSYGTNVDLHTAATTDLTRHRALLSVGHDEYWSWEMRQRVEEARDRCVSLGFFSANSVYWQVRFEPSPVTGAANRTLVAYKEGALTEDPLATDARLDNDHLITSHWRTTRPGSIGRPEDALLGVMYAFHPVDQAVQIVEPGHWAVSGISSTALPGLLGYEADRMFGNAPPGTVRLAHSYIPPTMGDYFCEPTADNCFSDMTHYRWPSGARVFASGTIQWSWGLDNFDMPGWYTRSLVNPSAQQITRNILNDFLRPDCSPLATRPVLRLPHVEVTLSNLPAQGYLRFVECISAGTCFSTMRTMRAGYSTLLLYGRNELAKAAPLQWLPAPPTHKPIGSRWTFESSVAQQGPVWVTLPYDAFNLSPQAVKALDVLYLVPGPQGLQWRVAPVSRVPNVAAIQARLPNVTTVMLGIRQ